MAVNSIQTSAMKTTNSYDSQLIMYVMGLNLTTKKVGLYFLNIVGKDPITGLDLMNYSPYVTQNTYIKNSNGKIAGLVTSEASEPTGSFTLKTTNDLNGHQADAPYGTAKNLLEILFTGGVFNHGTDKVKIVGVNGTNATASQITKCMMGWEYKNLFYYQAGKMKGAQGVDNDGNPILVTNTFIDKPNREVSAFALESYVAYDADTVVSRLLPFCFTSTITTDEDNTANSISAEIMKVGDIWNGQDSLIYNSVAKFVATDVDKVALEVDYIHISATTPTDFGKAGQTLLLVNPTTGATKLYTTDGSTAWTAVATGTFKQYAVITSNKLSTTVVATAVAGRVAVALKTIGTANAGFASNFAEDSTGAVKNFVCSFYYFDRENNGEPAVWAPTSTC